MTAVDELLPIPDLLTSRTWRHDVAGRQTSHERGQAPDIPDDAWLIIRADGRAFHTYTRHLTKPFCDHLATDLDHVAIACAAAAQGCVGVYRQSDELSLIYPPIRGTTQRAFRGRISKYTTIIAAVASATCTRRRPDQPIAVFDARAIILPDVDTVHEYLAWRQSDAARNAIEAAARVAWGRSAITGVGVRTLTTRLHDAGLLPARGHLAGRVIVPTPQTATITYTHRKTGQREDLTVTRHPFTAHDAPWMDADGYTRLLSCATTAPPVDVTDPTRPAADRPQHPPAGLAA